MQRQNIIVCYAAAVSFLWRCSESAGSGALYLFTLRLDSTISLPLRLLGALRHSHFCFTLRIPLFGRGLHRPPPTHYRETPYRTYPTISRLRIAGSPRPYSKFQPELVEVDLQIMHSILLWSNGRHLTCTRHLSSSYVAVIAYRGVYNTFPRYQPWRAQSRVVALTLCRLEYVWVEHLAAGLPLTLRRKTGWQHLVVDGVQLLVRLPMECPPGHRPPRP